MLFDITYIISYLIVRKNALFTQDIHTRSELWRDEWAPGVFLNQFLVGFERIGPFAGFFQATSHGNVQILGR